MSGLNQVNIVGRLGQDPDIRRTQSGDAIANISVATSEVWRDKNSGEKREKTEWHRIVIFGKPAEVVEKYVKKGDRIGIYDARIQTRKWQDKDGQDRYSTEIVVSGFNGRVELMSDKGGSGNGGDSRARSQEQSYNRPLSGSGSAASSTHDDLDDEIPF